MFGGLHKLEGNLHFTEQLKEKMNKHQKGFNLLNQKYVAIEPQKKYFLSAFNG